MSRNGSGTYSLPSGNPVVTGTTISSTWANNTLTDIATALSGLASVDTKLINDLPWKEMTKFSNAGGRITLAQSATGNFNLSQDTAKNIAHMDQQITQLVLVNKNLQALMAVMTDNAQAATVLQIDGRQVTDMIKRRADNAKAMNPAGH